MTAGPLGEFLKARRALVAPALPSAGRRRVPGLRREELAALAGLSPHYLMRLEQGRVQSAFLQATSSAALFLELGLPLSARWSYSLSALSLALAGVAGKAAETLAELDAAIVGPNAPIRSRLKTTVLTVV